MNAVRRASSYEVEVGNVEATEAKIDALRTKVDDMHASTHKSLADLQANIAALHATVKTMGRALSLGTALLVVFFSAGKALNWF